MSDPLALKRDTRRRNLDRRIRWRVVVRVGRNPRGETVSYTTSVDLWAKRVDALDLIADSNLDIGIAYQGAFLIRQASHTVTVPQSVISETHNGGHLDIPADGVVNVTIDTEDGIADGDAALRVQSVEELERRRWYLVRTGQ